MIKDNVICSHVPGFYWIWHPVTGDNTIVEVIDQDCVLVMGEAERPSVYDMMQEGWLQCTLAIGTPELYEVE